MDELTKAEEQVMGYIWKLEKGFLKDVVEAFPTPRPAYTTISTVIRVLVKKEVIGFNTYGKIHEYYPLVSKKEYSQSQLKKVVSNFFEGSYSNLTSAFTEKQQLDITELEKIRLIIENKIHELSDDNND